MQISRLNDKEVRWCAVRRVESGTTLPIMDIYGARDPRTARYEILCVAADPNIPGRSQVLAIENGTVREMATDPMWEAWGIWFIPQRLIGQDESLEPAWSVLLAMDSVDLGSSSGRSTLAKNEMGGSQLKPTDYALHPTYPNPFNPATTIKYDLPEPSHVSLVIYDVLGRKVVESENGVKDAGYHSAIWNASSVASGVYFARSTATNADGTVKLNKVTKLLLTK